MSLLFGVGGTDNLIKQNSGLEVANNGLVNGNYVQADPSQLPQPKNPSPWDMFINGAKDTLSNIGKGAGQVVNTAVSGLNSFVGSAFQGTPIGNILNQLNGPSTNLVDNSNLQPGENVANPQLDISGSSAGSNSQVDNSSAYNSGSDIAAPSANDYYYSLYQQTGDTAFLEKYIDNAIERENVASARAYEEYMSNTGFSRYVKDIESAGYNPWLALQNGGSSASSYTSQAAGSSGISQSSQATSRFNTAQNNSTKIVSSGISAIARIVGAFLNYARS